MRNLTQYVTFDFYIVDTGTGIEAEEAQEVVVQSPFRQTPKEPWNIPASVGTMADGQGSKPATGPGGPLSPVKPLPRLNSRLRGGGRKRKAGSRN